MDLPAPPDDALAQPTRARLFRLFAELGRPVGTAEPAGRLWLISAGAEPGGESPTGYAQLGRWLARTMSSLGSAPRREDHQTGALTYRLCNCPYRDAVRENAEVVCTLHRGITRGLLDELAPASTLSDFVPVDPALGNCLIELRGEIAAQGLKRLHDGSPSP